MYVFIGKFDWQNEKANATIEQKQNVKGQSSSRTVYDKKIREFQMQKYESQTKRSSSLEWNYELQCSPNIIGHPSFKKLRSITTIIRWEIISLVDIHRQIWPAVWPVHNNNNINCWYFLIVIDQKCGLWIEFFKIYSMLTSIISCGGCVLVLAPRMILKQPSSYSATCTQ